MFKNKKTLYITLSAAAVVIIGAFFAYNMHGYIVYARESQAARETALQTQRIFEAWQQNMQPPSTSGQTSTDLPTPQTTPDVRQVNPMDDIDPELFLSPEIPQVYDEYVPICFFTLLEAFRTETGNKDIIAFINVPGTNIQFVVAQSDDNEYYLNRDIFRRRNSSGTLFLDYNNSPDFSDPNSIIYGHHLRNGLKFTQLHLFRDPVFFHANRYIQLFTDGGLIEYEIFAVFVTDITFNYIQVEFEGNEFADLVNELWRRTYYRATTRPTSTDNILILSTCTSVNDDERLIVIGRRL
jgi:SrtB family sortase